MSIQIGSENNRPSISSYSNDVIKKIKANSPAFEMLLEEKLSTPIERLIKNTENDIKNTPTYKTSIIKNAQEVNSILSDIIQKNPQASVNYIADLDNLSDNNLIDTNLVVNNQHNVADIKQLPGLLVADNNQPVVLILDFRKINPANIAEFNQLFDTPPTIEGKEIGKHVEIISIVNHALLTMKNGPGSDFWRRVLNCDEFIETEDYDSEELTEFQKLQDELITKVELSEINNSNNKLIIDLEYTNWQDELFGYIDITDKGDVCYRPGKLTELKENQELYLKGAPWDDFNFQVQLYNVIKNNSYLANGVTIKLPANIQWHFFDGDPARIKNLQNEFKWDITEETKDLAAPGETVILNSVLFYSLMKTSTIKNGKYIKYDVLKNLLANASALKITDTLSENQWVTLLNRLKKIGRTDIIIIQDQLNHQPYDWEFNSSNYAEKYQNINNSQVKVIFNNMGFIPEIINKTDNALQIQIVPDTSASQLCSDFKKISLKNRTFDVTNTAFLNALKEGRPIDLYGLEHNMQLAYELESLFSNPPTLCINGTLLTFDKIDLTIHLANDTIAPTKTWQKALKNAKSKIKKNISTIKKELHSLYNINKNLSNKMVDKTLKLVNELNILPIESDSPKSDLIADIPLFNKIWKQVLDEQDKDKSKILTENHWIKAINSIVIKRYRENSETYHFAKNLVQNIFAVEKNNTIDSIGIKNWIKQQKEITPELVKQNVWLLSKYIPYDNLTFKKSFFQKTIEKLQKTITKENIKSFMTLKNIFFVFLKAFTLTITLIYYVTIEPIYKILNLLFILASKILPFINTRDFPEITFFTTKPQESLKNLAIADDSPGLDFIKTTLVYYAEEAEKARLQKSLNITNQQLQQHAVKMQKYDDCDYQIERLLRDICYSIDFNKLNNETKNKIESIGYQQFCHDLALNITKEKLKLSGNKNDTNNILQAINNHLQAIFPDKENNEERLKVAQYILNPETVTSKTQFWNYWVKRRSARLTSKIENHPIIMIKGSAGTGKSFALKAAAATLKAQTSFFNVRPNTKYEDLFGSFVAEVDEQTGEKKLVFKSGPIAKWAEQTGDDYKVLILDEFTLAGPIWDCLRTIYENPPYISINGKNIPLSKKYHRIAVTSNSDHYLGRQPNRILEQSIADMHYLPLSQEFQKEAIIAPEIDNLIESIHFSTDNKINNDAVNYITDSINKLYLQYERHIADYEFTPRDLTDCCSKIKTYFIQYISGEKQDPISLEMINSVTRRAMKETIASNIPPELAWKLAAIEPWHQAKFPGDDKIINEIDQMFDTFYTDIQIKNAQQNNILYKNYDLSNQLTHKLVRTVWQTLLRCHLEVKTKTAHKGRRASLIEGPAGVGKDTVVNMVIKYFEDIYGTKLNYNTITAGSTSIDKVIKELENKHKQGGVLSVAELNILDTQSLEGYMNQLLTDIPTSMLTAEQEPQTFHLFATINPSANYCSRSTFSQALLSRFTKTTISEHSYDDLIKICETQLTDKKYAEIIVKFHYAITSQLKAAEIRALPCLADIKKMASEFNKHANPEKFNSMFNLIPILLKSYKVYLKLAQWGVPEIKQLLADVCNNDINDNSAADNDNLSELTNWINITFHKSLDSILVTKGVKTEFIPHKGIFKLSPKDINKSNEEQKELITQHINFYLSPSTNPCPATDTDASSSTGTDIDTNNISKLATFKSDNKFQPLINQAKSQIKLYVANMHDGNFVNGMAYNMLLSQALPYMDHAVDYAKYQLDCGGADDLFLANSQERKTMAIAAIKELKEVKKLQNQLNVLCEQHDCTTKSVYDLLNMLAQSDNEISISANQQIFQIIGELDSAACGILGCMSLAFNVSFKAIELFSKIIAKGYIKFEDAIKFINNTNNLLLFTKARPEIFNQCCIALAEGNNVENISKILEYLMQGNADYFDGTILNNLKLLAEGKFTERLAKQAQEVLNKKYKKVLETNPNIKLTAKSAGTKPSKNIDPKLRQALLPDITNIVTKMTMNRKQLKIDHSYNPNDGNCNINRLVVGKPAFEKIHSVQSKSKNFFVMGVPNTRSKESATFVYHKPTNKRIDLNDLLDNLYTVKYPYLRYWLMSEEEIKALKIKILNKYQINATTADIHLFEAIYIRTHSIYYESSDCPNEHSYNYWEQVRATKVAKHEDIISKCENTEDCNFSYIREEDLLKLFYESILAEHGPFTFLLDLSHSNYIGAIKVKDINDVEQLINYLTNLMSYTPLVCPRDIDHEHADTICEFERQQIRKHTRNNEATIMFPHELIKAFNEAIKTH